MSRPKEVSFFQDTMDFKSNPNYEKGWEWYQKAFGHYAGEPVVGEATPSYSDRSRSPNTAKRIHEFNPGMKIIYMVRDPLERQISGWKMQWAFGKGKATPWRLEYQWALEGFETWMRKQREAGQWDVCRYAFQLQAYRDLFPEEQILVSFLEHWKDKKREEVSRILRFLNLDPEKWDPTAKESANRGSDRSIERPWFRQIRQTALIRTASGIFPGSIRRFASRRIGKINVEPPSIDRKAPIVAEFLKFVRDDCACAEPFRSCGRNIWMNVGSQDC